MSTDEGLRMVQHWVDQAISSFMSALANKRLKSKSKAIADEFGDCSHRAKSIPEQAKCVSRLLRDEIIGRRYRKIKLPKNHATTSKLTKFNPRKLEKIGKVTKNKTTTRPWQVTVQKLRDASVKRRQMEKRLGDESSENLEEFAFRGLKKPGSMREDLHRLIENPKKLKAFLSKKTEGMKLTWAAAGKNVSHFEDRNINVASPRFLSVTPEEQNSKDIDFLSPSLFSLHNEGKGLEKLASLPTLLKDFGGRDQQVWLDLIMEAAEVVEEADKMEEDLHKTVASNRTTVEDRKRFDAESRGKDGTPLYFTKENVTKMFGKFEERKIDTFQALTANLTRQQQQDMNQTGYTLLNPDQLYMIYGPHSPYNSSEALERLTKLTNLDRNITSLEHQMQKDIDQAAQVKSFKIRKKDIVLSPVAFTNIVLNSALISQPIILSPVIFSPVVLSVSVLGPLILSPTNLHPLVFVPFILSPVVLHPLILTPSVFVPIILSPGALVPFILSPSVFSPFILSPLALSPFIASPGAGSPFVLSPFVLSPVILSPQFLSHWFCHHMH
uniref:Uncharacterized protein n=1 Tax=Ditylenchus dipsaci TaxID=166011 RepID=A0A915EPB6_9BILA